MCLLNLCNEIFFIVEVFIPGHNYEYLFQNVFDQEDGKKKIIIT